MTTLTLPADRVAQQADGSWLITMPGVPCSCDPDGVMPDHETHMYPPDELVALTEPCQMAAESLSEPHAGHDCHAGRPLFDLKVECPAASHEPHWAHPKDCDDGFVTHAGLYVPGPILPVVHKDIRGLAPDAYVYVLDGDRRSWSFDHGRETAITLPVATQPGDFAVIAERRET